MNEKKSNKKTLNLHVDVSTLYTLNLVKLLNHPHVINLIGPLMSSINFLFPENFGAPSTRTAEYTEVSA